MDECKVRRARDIYACVMRRSLSFRHRRDQFPETIIFPVMFRKSDPKQFFGSIFTASRLGQNNIWAVKLHLTRQHSHCYTATHPGRNSPSRLCSGSTSFFFVFLRKSSNTITCSVLYINLVYRSKNYHSTHKKWQHLLHIGK